jgi:8-oxoguanine deaminase
MAGGAVHDPLAALVFCRPGNVDFTIVNGVPLVEHGAFTALDVERVVAQHNELARALVSR